MERVDSERNRWHELTVEDLIELKSLPVGDYFSIDPSGDGVFLHDALTLQPLEYGKVPEAIERTPELQQGLHYLRQLGQDGRLVVQLVLGSHGAADDFKRMVQDHGDILTAPLIGLEMADNIDGSLVVERAPGRGAFQTEQLQWVAQNNKTVLPCELPRGSDNEFYTRMDYLWDEIVAPASADRHRDPIIAGATAAIAVRSYQAVRQWAILARLGVHLQINEDLLSIDEQSRVSLVLGSWHEPSKDRLEMLGVPCEVYHSGAPEQNQAYKEYGELAMATMLFGYATMRFLRAPSPF